MRRGRPADEAGRPRHVEAETAGASLSRAALVTLGAMDAELNISNAPFRDPRYAPRRLEVEERPGGEMVLTNPTPYSTEFQTVTASLAHWAQAAPERVWLAERSGDGWRTVTFAEAWQRIAALAGGLLEAGIVGERPLLILARNAIDHALVA